MLQKTEKAHLNEIAIAEECYTSDYSGDAGKWIKDDYRIRDFICGWYVVGAGGVGVYFHQKATNKWSFCYKWAGRGFYDADINDLLESPAEVIEALNKVSDYDFADCKTAFESIRVQNGLCIFAYQMGNMPWPFLKELSQNGWMMVV